MKRIITVITLVLISQIGYSQGVLGSDVWIKNNAGTRGYVYREGTAFKMWDSTANVYNLAQKLKLDSLYTKINSSIAVTMAGHDSTTDSRIGVKLLQNPTIAGFASTPTVNIGTGGYAVSASDSNKYRIGIKVLESALPSGASTSALQGSTNTLLQGIKTIDSNSYGLLINSEGYLSDFATWTYNNTLPRKTDSTQTPIDGYLMYGTTRTSAPSYTNGQNGQLSLTDKGGLRVTLTDLAGAYVAAGGGGGGGGSSITALRDSSSSNTDFTMTGISSLASSATVGWQSDRVSNLTNKAIDYRVNVRLSCANTSPASDKCIYVYAIPFYTTDGGSTWYGNSLGTTTAPTGSAGAMTIANPHNLLLLGVLSYTTADMVLNGQFLLSNAWGDNPPDGFSIGIINFSGAALDATSGANNLISYKTIYKTNR